MSQSVSILIPTHNRASSLARALESLREVVVPGGAEVEVVVVANACSDDTVAAAREAAGVLPFPVRLVEEPTPNVNVARNAGVAASRGSIIAMLDDDVWVEPGWLAGLLEVYESNPADMVAGKVALSWEAGRPGWLTARHERMLSQCDHGGQVIELFRRGDALGANLSWRRTVADAIGAFVPGLDRTGKRLLGGGETEYVQRALARGFRMFYAPHAVVGHYMDPGRGTPEYLYSLCRQQAISHVYIDSATPWRAVATAFKGLGQLCRHWLSARWYALRGRRSDCIYHRARSNIGLGKVIGGVECLTGRTAVQQFRAAAEHGRGRSGPA